MKAKVLSVVSMFFLGTSLLFAQVNTEKFEVKGNCGMCKNRIEKAAKSVYGVSAADWNKETKIIEVSFDESKTFAKMVQMAIAKVGHDTPMHKASDKVYNALHGCCKYDRTETKDHGSLDVASIDKNKDGKVFQCTMCPDQVSDEAGRCAKCEMRLKEVTVSQAMENLNR